MSLVAELEDEEVGNIGEILKGFVPYLKVYKEYINSYDGAIKTVLEMRGKSKEFDKFLLDAFNDTLCDGLDFIAYLVTPIQRLPRYELMLKDLLNHSQEDKQLEDVYDKVTAVNKFLNESKRTAEMSEILMELQSDLWGEIVIFEPVTRKLIKDGPVAIRKTEKKKRKKGKYLQHYFFLFNDLLLETEKKNRRKKKEKQQMQRD